MKLRTYQQEAISALKAWVKANKGKHPVLSVSVGGGKSILAAELSRMAIEKGGRVLMLVPSAELVEQNYEKAEALLEGYYIGVISASIGRKDNPTGHPLLIATIGSIKSAAALGSLKVVIIDECHLVNSKADTGRYRQLCKELEQINPGLLIIGMTGTPFRGNGVWLHDGEDTLFDGIAHEIAMGELIKQDYLTPLRSVSTGITISSDGITKSNGDYNIKQLGELLDKKSVTNRIAANIMHNTPGRKRMVFCVNVAHMEHMRDALLVLGAKAVSVYGAMDKQLRKQAIEAFRSNEYDTVVSVACLTTGFDVPDVDCICWVRNTISPVLYVQAAGRGMRIADGKTECLWLDYTDTTSRLGPIDLIKGRPRKEPGSGEAPTKECPQCQSRIPAGAIICPECYAYMPRDHEQALTDRASGADIMATVKVDTEIMEAQAVQEVPLDVNGVAYRQLVYSGVTVNGKRVKASSLLIQGRGGQPWQYEAAKKALSIYDAFNQGKSRLKIKPKGKFYQVVGIV